MQNHAGPNNMCKKKRKTKRRGLHLSQNLLFWANQIGLLQKSKVELVRLPQLINMKQNKYPQFIKEVGCSLRAILARAKNGDKLFGKEKFHAANGKAQACTQAALLFLIGWWEDSFSFFPGSQMCSH
jgi:hypothetical protein